MSKYAIYRGSVLLVSRHKVNIRIFVYTCRVSTNRHHVKVDVAC